MSLLNIRNLTTGYYIKDTTNEVLKNVSLEIKKGEIFGIVGESGSGKTTLGLSVIRLLAGNALIKSGRINFEGKDLLKIREKKMVQIRGNKISMIFQDPLNTLNPVYTAGFQVKETIKIHQKITSKVKLHKTMISSFKTVRLKNPESISISYPHQLSGGMRQRVMIAQAISCKPSLLIADEPTSNLDVTIQKQILDLFKDLRTKLGLTILLISHDLELVKYICDKVAILNKGKIEEIGKSNEVFLNPQTNYTRQLINSTQFFIT